MQLNIKKYNKLDSGQPQLIATYDEKEAMVFDADPIIDERIELTQYFEFTVPSMEFTLSKKYLSQDVKDLLTTEGLSNNIIGVYFEHKDIKFDGYITPESVENSLDKKFYYITVINWWKYFYDEMAEHYCPQINTNESTYGLREWLELVFVGDVIKNISIEISFPNGFAADYYSEFAHAMKVTDVLKEIHKAYLCMFALDNGTLRVLDMKLAINKTTEITEIIENNSYSIQPLNPIDYDSALATEYTGVVFYTKKSGEFKQIYVDENLDQIPEGSNYLDIREKKTVKGTAIKEYETPGFEITAINGNIITLNQTPEDGWIDQIIETVAFGKYWRSTIHSIDKNAKTVTISWWGKDTDNTPTGEPQPYQACAIFKAVEEIIGHQVPGQRKFIIYKSVTLKEEDSFYRIFSPKGLTICNINSTAVSLLEKVTIGNTEYRVFAASKNAHRGTTELELEKID